MKNLIICFVCFLTRDKKIWATIFQTKIISRSVAAEKRNPKIFGAPDVCQRDIFTYAKIFPLVHTCRYGVRSCQGEYSLSDVIPMNKAYR